MSSRLKCVVVIIQGCIAWKGKEPHFSIPATFSAGNIVVDQAYSEDRELDQSVIHEMNVLIIRRFSPIFRYVLYSNISRRLRNPTAQYTGLVKVDHDQKDFVHTTTCRYLTCRPSCGVQASGERRADSQPAPAPRWSAKSAPGQKVPWAIHSHSPLPDTRDSLLEQSTPRRP